MTFLGLVRKYTHGHFANIHMGIWSVVEWLSHRSGLVTGLHSMAQGHLWMVACAQCIVSLGPAYKVGPLLMKLMRGRARNILLGRRWRCSALVPLALSCSSLAQYDWQCPGQGPLHMLDGIFTSHFLSLSRFSLFLSVCNCQSILGTGKGM